MLSFSGPITKLLTRFAAVTTLIEEPEIMFLWLIWVENGQFELKLCAFEAKSYCGPFPKIVEA